MNAPTEGAVLTLEVSGIPVWAIAFYLQHISRHAGHHGLSIGAADTTIKLELIGLRVSELEEFKAWVQTELEEPVMGFSSVILEGL
jgi:hypothetical protein